MAYRIQYIPAPEAAMDDQLNPPDGLTATPVVNGVYLEWQHSAVGTAYANQLHIYQLFVSATNDRTNATLLAETAVPNFMHIIQTVRTFFCWVRARMNGRYSEWLPTSPSADVNATANQTNTNDLANEAAQSIVQVAAVDSHVFGGGYFSPSGPYFTTVAIAAATIVNNTAGVVTGDFRTADCFRWIQRALHSLDSIFRRRLSNNVGSGDVYEGSYIPFAGDPNSVSSIYPAFQEKTANRIVTVPAGITASVKVVGIIFGPGGVVTATPKLQFANATVKAKLIKR